MFKSIEIELGASQLSPWEESMSHGRRLPLGGWKWILFIHQVIDHLKGKGLLEGGLYLTRNWPNRPYIYL